MCDVWLCHTRTAHVYYCHTTYDASYGTDKHVVAHTWHTYECVTSHLCIRHVTCMNASRHAHKLSHVTRMDAVKSHAQVGSSPTYESVTLDTRLKCSNVTHLNKVMSHTEVWLVTHRDCAMPLCVTSRTGMSCVDCLTEMHGHVTHVNESWRIRTIHDWVASHI